MLRDGRLYLHISVDEKGSNRIPAYHVPRVGDTLRLPVDRYVRVTEVIWCYDEDSGSGERVSIRAETIR